MNLYLAPLLLVLVRLRRLINYELSLELITRINCAWICFLAYSPCYIAAYI